jgi:hypothetical protein
MINENFVILGALIAFFGPISYLIDTIKGKVKPHRVSFLMWSLTPLVTFFAQVKSGVGIQSLLTLAVGLTPLSIFIASFFNKKSEWKLTTFDFVCGALSFTGFILYLITRDAFLAVLFSIIADSLASLPTIIKSFYYPETESPHSYLATSISAVLTLLTLKYLTFVNSAFTIYIFIICTTIFVFVQYKPGKLISKPANLKHNQKF